MFTFFVEHVYKHRKVYSLMLACMIVQQKIKAQVKAGYHLFTIGLGSPKDTTALKDGTDSLFHVSGNNYTFIGINNPRAYTPFWLVDGVDSVGNLMTVGRTLDSLNNRYTKSQSDSRYPAMTDTASNRFLMTRYAAASSIATVVPKTTTITINGITQDLSANRTFSVGTLVAGDTAGRWLPITYVPTASQITSALTYTPYNGTTNVLGFLTAASITGKLNNTLNSGNIFVGNGSNIATGVAMSGDATISNSGVLTLGNTGVSAGQYGRLTINTKGLVTAGKRQETYSGTSDASGLYTVTFSTAYSVAPNIQAQLIGGTDLTFFRVVSVSTTGFQVYAFTRSSISSLPIIGVLTSALLGSAGTALSGANIDVLITEK